MTGPRRAARRSRSGTPGWSRPWWSSCRSAPRRPLCRCCSGCGAARAPPPRSSWQREMMKLLAGAFPGRAVHGTGDAAFHGESLIVEGTTWTTQAAGQRGAVRAETAARPGSAAGRGSKETGWAPAPRSRYRPPGPARSSASTGTTRRCRSPSSTRCGTAASRPPPAASSWSATPDSGKPYDLALFTLDTQASPAAIAERYSWRWADRAVERDRQADPRRRRRLQPGREGRRAHRPVRVPDPVPAGRAGTPSAPTTQPTSTAGAGYARGTAPRPARHPPTCSPGSAASSPKPDFPPSGQATTATIKPTWMPGPATAPPPNSENHEVPEPGLEELLTRRRV